MQETITIDDDLLEQAKQLSGLQDIPALMHEALTALIQRESARQLAALGGSDPTLVVWRR